MKKSGMLVTGLIIGFCLASPALSEDKNNDGVEPAAIAAEIAALREDLIRQEQALLEQRRRLEELERKLASIQPAVVAEPMREVAPPSADPQASTASANEPQRFRAGAVLYADYAYYFNTSFGPQFLTQINQPGPGNNGYNTFDLHRTYLNMIFTPSDALSVRITPNIYRQIGAAPGSRFGAVSAIAPNTDGELAFRLKYAYLDLSTLFQKSSALKQSKIRIGQQMNPLIDWEESLWGYRFVGLVPWNYLSLSSTQVGVTLQGPIKSGDKQYLDYSIGVFNNASFRQLEQTDRKQGMARLTVYPSGAASNYQGLGLTGFIDYGYTNAAPDTDASRPLYRAAFLAHYASNSNGYGVAAEYDLGRNTFTSGNLFSGSGPADEFGLGPTVYAGMDALARSVLNRDGAKQRGFALFGHAAAGRTPFTFFGMFQQFQPNIVVSDNPFDFRRLVAGVSYKYNDQLRFALSSQNLLYTQSASRVAVPNGVPKDIRAAILSTEFNF
jgi:hypothetical protein